MPDEAEVHGLLAPLLATPALASYQPLHAAHAELLRRAGDGAGASRAYARAIELSTNDVERAELERRRDGADRAAQRSPDAAPPPAGRRPA